jgi:hypothetical protein
LRNRLFFSLEELNEAVLEQVRLHNRKRMQQREYSREEHFIADEKQMLKPLPQSVFEGQYDTELTVSANCCVYLGRDKHYYPVPYQYIGQKVKVIYTRSLVKIYLRGESIATHSRIKKHEYTMLDEHLASNSKAYTRMSARWYIAKGTEINPFLGEFVQSIFASSDTPPEFFYKRCDGLLHLARVSSPEDLEEACRIAIENRQYSYKFIQGVLKNIKALKEDETGRKNPQPDNHENIRGAGYYR